MEKRISKNVAAAALTSVLFVAAAWLLVADVDDQYSEWGAPVNLGPPVNTIFVDTNPFISQDGLSLYFACNNCPGGFGGLDIWVAQRACTDAADPACAWQTPVNLGPTINTVFNDHVPALSPDGHQLFFASDRIPGGFGANDLYVSRRHNKRDDFAWQPPVNLGPGVNTSFNETVAAPFEDDVTGIIALYIVSNRPGMGNDDIYVSTLQPDETFGPPLLVPELSTIFRDTGPSIRRDGLEMFLASNRPGTSGPMDIWVSTRASTSEPWSTPVNLGPVVNSVFIDARPALSFDGTELYFQRPSHPANVSPFFDIWRTTRTKL